MPDALTREMTIPADTAQLRAAADGGREFTGIAVPWDSPIDIWGMREEFAPGSIEPHPDGVMAFYRHDEPVGTIGSYRDADAGWEVTGRLSDTATGRDAATLLRDGVIKKLSIRFEPVEWETVKSEDGVEHVRYTRALVREVSLVPIPAYDAATITQVRHRADTEKEKHPMPEDKTTEGTAELSELRGSIDELTRRVELIGTADSTSDANPLHQFRSFGEFVKTLAAGDEDAQRAYTGVVSGDIALSPDDNTWVGNMLRLVEARTPTVNFFTHTKDLPPTGETVDYGRLETSTLQVAEQVNEGDDLVYGKVGITGGQSAPVRTIGGWTDLSRQAIERRSYNVVDLTFRGFAIAYATALEAIAKAQLTTVYNARVALSTTDPDGAGPLTADPDAVISQTTLATADDVIDLLLTLAERYDASTYNLDAIWLGRDLFRDVAHIDEDKKILSLTSNPDKLGTLSLSTVEANIANLPVKLWTGAPSATAAMAVDRQAIKVQESPGAPFRLQDENIINLTKQFSVYGYVAAYSEMPEGVVPIVIGV